MYVLHEHKYIIAGLGGDNGSGRFGLWGSYCANEPWTSAHHSAAPTLAKSRIPFQILCKTGILSRPCRARFVSDKQTVLHAPFPLKFPEYPLFFISTTRLNIPEIPG
jgi:hypothetical protein